MRPRSIRNAKYLIATAAVALALGCDVAGWGGTCTTLTPKPYNVYNNGTCLGHQCQGVTGGGCFDPMVNTTNWICGSQQTQTTYTCCSFGPSGCSANTCNITVNYGVQIPYNCQ